MKATTLKKIDDFDELEISNDEYKKIESDLSKGFDNKTQEDKEAERLLEEMIALEEKLAHTNPKNFYLVWSQVVMEKAELDALTTSSKINQVLARLIFGSFKKQVIAPFAYWSEQDKIRCLPLAFDPKLAGNELVKRNKYITTRQIQELRNQFADNALSFANSVSLVVSVSIFMTMYFFSMSGINKAAILTAIAGGVAYKFRDWIKQKTKQEKSYLLHRVLFGLAASIFLGNLGYVKVQQIQNKIQAEKKAESIREDSLTSAVEEFKKANDAWLNTVEANKPYAAQTFLNHIVNLKLEQFVQTMNSMKKDVGSDFYKSRVKEVQDVLVQKDVPVFSRLLGEGVVKQSDVETIQTTIEEKMKRL
ncbi:hypothetical protein DFLDMN_001660 [Cupriavidus sp. H19C3]|uniref:hypothetical protein n=1 Tax=Cupriavidus sp. H19C3 TaxID=3241603 RepID=UPI003BF7D209